MKTDNIIVILLNFNDSESVQEFIYSHQHFKRIEKIIVVDNCSTDDSFEKIKAINSEKVELISSLKNGGYSYGNNFGVKYVNDNYIVDKIIICNPDVIFKEDLINEMVRVLEHDSSIAQVTGIMNGTTIRKQNIAWRLPSFKDQITNLIYPFKTNSFDKYISSCFSNDKGFYVDVISGAFFMTRISTFIELGLFDERTFLYGEENILAYKIKLAKKKNFLLRDFSYIHLQEKSINKTIKHQTKKFQYLNKANFVYNRYYLKLNIFFSVSFYVLYILRYSLLLFIRRMQKT